MTLQGYIDQQRFAVRPVLVQRYDLWTLIARVHGRDVVKVYA